MILRLPTKHENPDRRHAGMDCRHPGVQGCLGNVHVNLDSSTHAGMTELKVSANSARYVIIEEGHEADHQTQS